MPTRETTTPSFPALDPAAADAIVAEATEALAPRIQVVSTLGVGGMAIVLLARDPLLRRSVAVKVLAPERAKQADARELFLREAQAAAAIDHPSVIRVYEVGELPRSRVPYFVMQFVEGGSLAETIGDGRSKNSLELRRTIGEIASGLAAAHARGVVHRDVKPENVIVDRASGRPIVVDFGISAAAAVGTTPMRGDAKTSHDYIGTPAYTSPEQAAGSEITDRSDVYSLGVLAFQLATGRLPFEETSGLGMLSAHMNVDAPKVEKVRPDLDPELAEIINACLKKKAAARPSAASIAHRLAPAGDVVLEWPPPGLDDHMGRIRRVSIPLAIGCGLVGIPAFVAMTESADEGLGMLVPSGAALGVVVFAGAYLVLAALVTLVYEMWRGRRASRQGYSIMTVLEVLADRRRDTGALIAGVREYASVTRADRALVRRRRIQLAVSELSLAASLALIPVVSIAIATHAGLEPGKTQLVAVLLLTLVFMTHGRLVQTEVRLLGQGRGHRQRKGRQLGPDRSIVEAWTRGFDRLRVGQQVGLRWAARSWRLVASVTLAMVLIVWVTLALATVSALTALKSALAELESGPSNVVPRVTAARRLRAFDLPADSTVSTARATDALTNISAADAKSVDTTRRAPTIVFDTVWEVEWSSSKSKGLVETFKGDRTQPWTEIAIARASKGLTPDERRVLQYHASLPTRPEFEILARAARVDNVGAIVPWPIPEHLSAYLFPIMHFRPIREAAYATVAQAALDLDAGRRDSAERRLRGIMHVGFLLLDGPTILDNLVGVVLVNTGRQPLATLYGALGRGQEAAQLSNAATAIDSVDLRRQSSIRGTARTKLAEFALTDSTAPRGQRFESIRELTLSQCSDPRSLLFGDPVLNARIDSASRQLVRFPSESVVVARSRGVLGSQVRTIDLGSQDGRVGAQWIARQFDRVVGGHRFENCVALIFLHQAIY